MLSAYFTRGLLLTTLLVGACIGIEYLFIADLQPQWPFLLVCLAVFALLTVVINRTATKAAKHEKQIRLAQYIMVLTFAKMVLSIAVVVGYYYLADPPSRSFLLPFFTAYFGFTIFETLFLLRLNKATATKPQRHG